jgi:hypothetical protein
MDSKPTIETQEELVAHYRKHRLQVDDVVAQWELNFRIGNALKYLIRCDHKGSKETDLAKAIWYIVKEATNNNETADRIANSLLESF